jgi:hypothetical protein
MTTPRRLAVRISRVVVRLASPGAQDWAKATAREVEFIGSDWVALRWALGSTRILFGCPEARLTSLAQVPDEARRLARELRARTIFGSSIAIFEAFAFSFFSVRLPALVPSFKLGRAGCVLTAAAALWAAYRFISQRSRKLPSHTGPPAIAAYRAELERQRDFLSLRQLCVLLGPLVLGTMVMTVGMVLAVPRTARISLPSQAAIFFFSAVAAHGFRKKAARFQRRIDELDTLSGGVAG